MVGGANQIFFERNGSVVEAEFLSALDLSLPSASAVTSGLLDFSGRAAAFLLFVVASPIFALCALLVKLSSRGPVFYAQERVGVRGRSFRIYKFRSMVVDAEVKTGPTLSWTNDPRVTAIGKVLRNLHLDELPQLINVLKGEMALIGPRPERPEFVRQFNESIANYGQRSAVKPGITGLAQVCGRYDASPEEKLRYDLLYVSCRTSLKMNTFILYNTVKKLLWVRFNQ